MSLRNLRDRRVLVTGAASGIGRATAIAFAREGACLVLCDLEAARLDAVRDAILKAGGSCVRYCVDVTDEAAMQDFAAQVHREGGAIDVLVNDGGLAGGEAFLDSSLATWHRTLRTNVSGVEHGMRAFLPMMHDVRGVRRVVNIASLAGAAPAPNLSAFTASRSAVIGLSESVALELRLRKSEVGMTVVCPDVVDTAIVREIRKAARGVRAAGRTHPQAGHQTHGVRAETVADAIVEAVRSGRSMVTVGRLATLRFHARRMSLALLRKLLVPNVRTLGYD